MQGAFLGPEICPSRDRANAHAVGRALRAWDDDLLDAAVEALADGKRSAGFKDAWNSDRGRSAHGPSWAIRAPEAQKKMNLKVKYRESFRPFAPSVLREDSALFELDDRRTCSWSPIPEGPWHL